MVLRSAFCLLLAAAPRRVPVTSTSPKAVADYQQALVLIDDSHLAEATAALKKALSLDPHFASAHAALATLSNPQLAGPELAAAEADAANLPEAERDSILMVIAANRGDDAKARALRRRVVELAPDDWRAQQALGVEAIVDRDWPRAVKELEKSTALDPSAGGALNMLGYAYMMSTRYDDAAATLRRYAAAEPKEPNPHDSLAEALMNGGHLAESEAEFKKALQIDPHFPQSWMAIAELRFMQGDWKAGEEALARERAVDVRPGDKLATDMVLSQAQLAQGHRAEGEATFAKALQAGEEAGQPQLFARTQRTQIFEYEGQAAEALAASQAELQFIDKMPLDEPTKDTLRAGSVLNEVRAHALLKHPADAKSAQTRLEKLLAPQSKQAFVTSLLFDGRGLVLQASGDLRGAVESMKRCLAVDSSCQWDLHQAQELAGDHAGAHATRAKLFSLPIRSMNYVYVVTKLGGLPK